VRSELAHRDAGLHFEVALDARHDAADQADPAREARGRGIGIGRRRDQQHAPCDGAVRQRQHRRRAAHGMADDRGERAVALGDATQRAGEARQGAAAFVAAAVARLIERDHRVTGFAQRAHPRQETQRVAGPAVREQHARLRLHVAPLVHGHATPVDFDVAAQRATVVGVACAHAAGRERRAQQPRRAAGRGVGGELAADAIGHPQGGER